MNRELFGSMADEVVDEANESGSGSGSGSGSDGDNDNESESDSDSDSSDSGGEEMKRSEEYKRERIKAAMAGERGWGRIFIYFVLS